MSLPSLLILAAALLAQAGPEPSPYTALRAPLDAAYVEVLLEQAEEAGRGRRYARRETLYERVLRLAPDHPDARRGLRFRRKDGEWVRQAGYHPARNHREGEPELEAAADRAAFAAYRDGCLDLIERCRDQLGRTGARDAWREVRSLFPRDEVLGRLLGEVPGPEGWVLWESEVAVDRRAAIRDAVAHSFEAVPELADCALDFQEQSLGTAWPQRAATSRVRVLGSVPADEVERAARALHAAGDLFRDLMGARPTYRAHFSAYLVPTPSEGRALVARWPRLTDEVRAFLAPLHSGWLLPEPRVVAWSAEREERLDGLVRQTFGVLMIDAFGVDEHIGWAFEGFGLYLTEALIGTRLTHFVPAPEIRTTRAGRRDEQGELESDELLTEALRLAQKQSSPRLKFLLGRSLESMTGEDLAVSYALVSYLIEAHPAAIASMLRRLGSREHPTTVVEDELGMSLEELENRLARWLRETASGQH